MQNNVYIYIFIMAGVSFLIRALPLTLIRKPIRNQFFRSFLCYVPYVTLAIMTFPSILWAPSSPLIGAAALIAGAILAWRGKGLFPVAIASCTTVFLLELFI